MLHLLRAAMSWTVASSETTASSQAQPRAIDRSNAARRSILIGRACERATDGGSRISRGFFDGGLHQGTRSDGVLSSSNGSTALDRASLTSELFSQTAT